MTNKDLTIINKLGLHARAAAKLVALASNFQSDIFLEKEGKKVNGKSIMGVMMLAASKGSIVTVAVDGDDEHEALTSIEKLFNNYFDEEE
ncbi:MAG: HPr family phosphocarrier protein [Gammaproteobacteria bacterium]